MTHGPTSQGNDTAAAARAAAAAPLALLVAVLPVFLTGALAVFIRAELGFGEAELGIAVAVFFAVAGLAAVPGGRFVQRVGWRAGMAVGSACSLVTLYAVAGIVGSWIELTVLLAFGGVAVAVIDPAASLALSRCVPAAWQSRAFGMKEAAIPAATLIAGGSIPLLALRAGWRPAFAGAALLVGVLWLLLLPRLGQPPASHVAAVSTEEGRGPAWPLTVLAVAAGFGVAAATSLGIFLVESAVAGGLSASAAGTLLVAGSAAGVSGRLVAGWLADRQQSRAFAMVAVMFAAGAAGFALLASGRTWAVVAGTLLGFAAGWGWTGLLYFGVVRARSADPARASGVVLTGLAAGGAAGPLAFGPLAAATSFQMAWLAAAGLAVAAALLTALGARGLQRGVSAPRPL